MHQDGFTDAIHGTLWNRLIPDRAPQLVVRAADEDDVIAAVKFARTNGLKVVVRGGGHTWCRHSFRTGGLMLDLQDFTTVLSIDVENRRAVIQPIISNRDPQKILNPLAWLGETAPLIAPSVERTLFLVKAPPVLREAAAAQNGWVCLVTPTAFEETSEAARGALRPLEHGPVEPPSRATATPLDFEQLFDAPGALFPEAVRSRMEAANFNHSPGGFVQAVLDLWPTAPSDTSVFLLTIFCGPDVPRPQRAMARSMTSKDYGGPWTIWRDAGEARHGDGLSPLGAEGRRTADRHLRGPLDAGRLFEPPTGSQGFAWVPGRGRPAG